MAIPAQYPFQGPTVLYRGREVRFVMGNAAKAPNAGPNAPPREGERSANAGREAKEPRGKGGASGRRGEAEAFGGLSACWAAFGPRLLFGFRGASPPPRPR